MDTRNGLQALRRSDRLSVRAAEQLESYILDGELQPGDRLPPERNLAAKLHVSRTIVREAIRMLEAHGLLVALPSGGMSVRKVGVDTVSRSLDLLMRSRQVSASYSNLHEVRRVLEVEVAARAAERIGEPHLANMERALDEMRSLRDRVESGDESALEQFTYADEAFHTSLAAATGNPLFEVLLDTLADITRDFRRMTSHIHGAPENAIDYHAKILECARNRNTKGISDIMMRHLEASEEFGRQAESN